MAWLTFSEDGIANNFEIDSKKPENLKRRIKESAARRGGFSRRQKNAENVQKPQRNENNHVLHAVLLPQLHPLPNLTRTSATRTDSASVNPLVSASANRSVWRSQRCRTGRRCLDTRRRSRSTDDSRR